MRKLVEAYTELPHWLRQPLWRVWHNLINWWERQGVLMTLMNYGYAYLDGARPPPLEPRDEDERYAIQLYHETASATQVEGKEILEVGSGRGGGASYITRYLRPKRYVGLDISKRCIQFCNTHHAVPSLRFVKGHSESIPFGEGSFDVVLSVEATRGFGDLGRFLSEVHRVLRPNGTFLLTDMRWRERVEELRATLANGGFRSLAESDITANVIRALQIDSRRKLRLIERKVPRLFLKAFSEFAGVEGTHRFDSFASGRMQYWRFVLERQARGDPGRRATREGSSGRPAPPRPGMGTDLAGR